MAKYATIFDVTRAYNVASEAVTVDSNVFDDPLIETTPVVADDGNTYDVVLWGHDNKLPYVMKKKVEANSVMSQNKFFNVLTCYGRGLEYMDLATRGEKAPLPCVNEEVRRFFVRNNLKRFFAEQISDLKFYYFCVCVFIMSNDRTKIVRVVHKDACHVRFQKADENGRVKNILYGNWENDMVPADVEAIPLLDEYDPLDDLCARTDAAKDPLGVFKVMPAKFKKFAVVCRMPTVGCSYYPIPPWTSAFRDGWYNLYGYLTAAKTAKIKNGQNIRYHVEINEDFWRNRAADSGISFGTPEYVNMKTEFVQSLRDYLSGSANSDKVLWSEFKALLDGKEMHNIKVNVVDTSKAGNEYNDDVAEVANVLCYNDNVHPNLAGATPGKSQMNNSGSDKRELFTMKQALETLPHDIMMTVHHTIIFYNQWEKLAYPDVPMIILTTLDKNTDAKEVSMTNPDNNE